LWNSYALSLGSSIMPWILKDKSIPQICRNAIPAQ
jgi:hypothetical protein